MPDRSRRDQVVNSVFNASQIRDTVDFDRAASGPSASARSASMSRSDRPLTHPEITKASSGADRTTPLPNSWEA